ncbi:hypothetical protein FHR22_001113 [Sphingopyxis panaciterrae]|uniref:hypothetical protein n=1 Tax=Sphingopyxis panaciterrae TaxID=363841 RepID=UPI0014223CEC|nr:hypothetical protein [Sphingopyxis panaciterrae]NIJ36464.1 hypothetical protein [Sphingopyxis panaciterrae]
MRSFYLLLKDDSSGEPKRIDFEAESPDFALQIAQGQASGRDMELWEGAMRLGTLSKAAPQLWRLS